MTHRNLLCYLQLGAAMVIFGSAVPVSKIVAQAFPVFLSSVMRITLAAVILLPFMLADRNELGRITRRDWLILLLIAFSGIFLVSVLLLFGMRMVPGVLGSIVMSTEPAVAAVGSFLVLGESLGWRKISAVALTVVGVLVVNLAGAQASNALGRNQIFGSLLIFGVVCGSVTYTIVGKEVLGHLSSTVLATVTAALAIPMFLPFVTVGLGDFSFSYPTLGDWAALAWYGAGSLGLGSLLWCKGLTHEPGSVAAGFMGIQPISGLVLSYLLLGEPFRWLHVAGFGIVFAGVLLIAWAHAHYEREEPADSADQSVHCSVATRSGSPRATRRPAGHSDQA